MTTSNQEGPDPTGAQTPQDFMNLLRQARTSSGLSIVEIADRAKQRGYDLDPAELAGALAQPTLPTWQTVTGVLAACGLGGMQIDRWMRVYHDLGAPPQPVAPPPPAPLVPPAPADTATDLVPLEVPPLVLAEPPAPSRVRAQRLALVGGAIVLLIVLPLVLFNVFSADPDPVAGEQTDPAPRTSAAAPPAASPTEEPVVQPSPTEAAAPTTPAPVTTTVKPPVKTTGPPAPPPPPPPPPPPADPGVLRSGVASLTGDQGVDLDGDGRNDIFRWDSDSLARQNDSALEPVEGVPTKQTCDDERGWEGRVDRLVAGQWLCVFTSSDKFGKLNITAVGDTLKVAYTIWT